MSDQDESETAGEFLNNLESFGQAIGDLLALMDRFLISTHGDLQNWNAEMDNCYPELS